MTVFYVLLAFVLIFVLGYIFLLFFKKNKANIFQKLKENIAKKKELKLEKKQMKLQKKSLKEEKEEVDVKEEKTDPDVQVQENGLEYDGFFNNDFSKKEEMIKDEEALNDNLDDLFENLFSDTNFNKQNKGYNYNSNYDLNSNDDLDLNDFDVESFKDGDDISSVIKNLPPEVKAMLLSNVLNRKDDI